VYEKWITTTYFQTKEPLVSGKLFVRKSGLVQLR